MKHRNFHLLLFLVLILSTVIGQIPLPARAFGLIIWLGAATIYIGGAVAIFVRRVGPTQLNSNH